MSKANISKATLGRLPGYLKYIRDSVTSDRVSASAIARGMGLGEVQVRKDLNAVCENGKPKVGYETKQLTCALEALLGLHRCEPAVIVGAGKMGLALQGYDGFRQYGLEIVAIFDNSREKCATGYGGRPIYPVDQFEQYCRANGVRIGILTVPAASAQSVCEMMVRSGITAIWNFAPCRLHAPEYVMVKHENLALSLAHLYVSARDRGAHTPD